MQAVCAVLKVSRRRVERWQQRRDDLVDRKPGGVAVNSLLADEIAQILGVFDEWGERDRSHRRLAHRGSYLGRFWASPSTVRRVLIESDKHFRPLPRPVQGERRPFPDWASYRPNSLWIYDTTRLKSHCEQGHQPWPARSRHVRHTGDNQRERRSEAFADDARDLNPSELVTPTRPRLRLLNPDTGELSDFDD